MCSFYHVSWTSAKLVPPIYPLMIKFTSYLFIIYRYYLKIWSQQHNHHSQLSLTGHILLPLTLPCSPKHNSTLGVLIKCITASANARNVIRTEDPGDDSHVGGVERLHKKTTLKGIVAKFKPGMTLSLLVMKWKMYIHRNSSGAHTDTHILGEIFGIAASPVTVPLGMANTFIQPSHGCTPVPNTASIPSQHAFFNQLTFISLLCSSMGLYGPFSLHKTHLCSPQPLFGKSRSTFFCREIL